MKRLVNTILILIFLLNYCYILLAFEVSDCAFSVGCKVGKH